MHTLYYSITIKQWYLLDHFAALSIKSVTKIVKQSLENMTFLSIRFENFLKFDKRGSKYGPSGEKFFWKSVSVPFVFGTLEWSDTDFSFTQNSCYHFYILVSRRISNHLVFLLYAPQAKFSITVAWKFLESLESRFLNYCQAYITLEIQANKFERGNTMSCTMWPNAMWHSILFCHM